MRPHTYGPTNAKFQQNKATTISNIQITQYKPTSKKTVHGPPKTGKQTMTARADNATTRVASIEWKQVAQMTDRHVVGTFWGKTQNKNA